jgi:hypothetical protein
MIEQSCEDDDGAVAAAALRFYAALNAIFRGDVAPMVAVWSHHGDATYMGPDGGRAVGWQQVLASWQAQAALRLAGEVRPDGLRIIRGQDLAATCSFVDGHTFDAQGTRRAVRVRDSNLFRNEAGAWKMIAAHVDLLPHVAP